MKRPRTRPSTYLENDCDTDIITSSSTDSDGNGDVAYETDLSESDDAPSPPKRHRLTGSAPALGWPDGDEVMYDDPLDDTGIDLSEIPEDFDKAEGTIVRRERIESRWKRSETRADIRLGRLLLTIS